MEAQYSLATSRSVHNERYLDLLKKRKERLAEAFKVAPDTGHAPGHKYPKK